MRRSAEEILYLYHQRKDRLSPMHRAALEVRAAYYGEITLPLPELDRNEKPLVANLLLSAGEQKSMRVASTMPTIFYPSTKRGQKLADTRANDRRLVNQAWWDLERMTLKMRKRARHMVYYASSAVMLRPNFKEHRPRWQTRNPLTTLAPDMDSGDVSPEDIIFTYDKSFAWLVRKYPEQIKQFGMSDDVQDGTFTILEYQDEYDTVLLAVGDKVDRAGSMYPQAEPQRREMIVELDRQPNRVGKCTAVMAGGIGLEHPRGSFDGTIGMWQALGKIMALEAIGMQKAIWPEEWLISDQTGDGATVVVNADPLHGIMGQITGGQIKEITPQLNQQGMNLADRLERGIRLEGGIPPELGGESGSNIRTGKRGEQILSSVLDFPLQEMQEILAVSLQEENKIAIAIDKAYFPRAKSVFISATAGEIEYEPAKLWDTDAHFVRYSHAGVDAQGLVVELGQLVGIGILSKRSAMESHPLIEDPEAEFDRITVEHLREALLAGLGQMAQDPNMAPVIADTIINVQKGNVEVEDAVKFVHTELQKIQAQQAQEAQAAAMSAQGPMPPQPEQQPGMGQPQPSIAPPAAGVGNLSQLLRNLRQGPMSNVPNQLGIAS